DKDGAPIPNVILSGVSFKGPIGVLGGASGVLMLSTDAGATWELLPKPTSSFTTRFQTALVVETQPALRIAGITNTAVYTTTDKGQSWTTAAASGAALVNGAVASDGTLYAVGGPRLYRSTDKGASFTLLSSAGDSLRDVRVIGPDTLLLAGGSTATLTPVRRARISGTTVTWDESTRTDSNSSNLFGLSNLAGLWVDEQLNGFAVGFQGAFWAISGTATTLQLSTPVAVSGAQVEGTTAGNMQCIHFPTAQVGYATGPTHGAFYKTTNGGRNWTTLAVDPALTNELLHAVHFVDAQLGFGVGAASHTPAGGSAVVNFSQYVVRTTNGGATWTPVQLPADIIGSGTSTTPRAMRGVAFSGPELGFVVGDPRSSTDDTFALKWNASASRFDKVP
ncbi:MAG: WD40/YVTN/BNR-like repeat-containing protein, partial [Myxococcales bacterium]